MQKHSVNHPLLSYEFCNLCAHRKSFCKLKKMQRKHFIEKILLPFPPIYYNIPTSAAGLPCYFPLKNITHDISNRIPLLGDSCGKH